MKQNKIRISVELWDKDNNVHSHFGGDKVTVVQEMELPVAAPGDNGTGQLTVVLNSFQRHALKELQKLGVIDKVDVGESLTLSVDSKLFNEAFEKALDELAAEYGVPKYMLLGRQKPVVQPIPFEPTPFVQCRSCKGEGVVTQRQLIPSAYNPDGDVADRRVICCECEGEGKVPLPMPVAAIEPDPQSIETCDKCKGHGYLQSDVPTSTNQHGEVFYERIPCPSCAGAGKVGV